MNYAAFFNGDSSNFLAVTDAGMYELAGNKIFMERFQPTMVEGHSNQAVFDV